MKSATPKTRWQRFQESDFIFDYRHAPVTIVASMVVLMLALLKRQSLM